MIFRQRFLDGIRDGTITLAFRRWRRPSVRAGGTLLTAVGQLEIVSVDEVAMTHISDQDARRAGYASRNASIPVPQAVHGPVKPSRSFVRIRAVAVFERVVYNCFVTDPSRPDRPVLEVDAVLREGDADGPILLPVPQYMALVGGPEEAERHLRALSRQGRLVEHQGVTHLSFPTWRVVEG